MLEMIKYHILSALEGRYDESDKEFDEFLRNIESKRVKPVTYKHSGETGRWIAENARSNSYLFLCSECGGKVYSLGKDEHKRKFCNYEFCPHCGIRMEAWDGGFRT